MQKKKRVLVTGGPTRAYFDDVRYISNVSSGKTAFEICKELKKNQHEVYAVIGPTDEPFDSLGLEKFITVETNQQMHEEVLKLCRKSKPNWGVFAAAVLDFVPTKTENKKVSSKEKKWTVTLKPAPKIIDEVKSIYPDVRVIGFKLQTRKTAAFEKEFFSEELIRKKKLFGLCLNFLEEVSAKKHHAFLSNCFGEKKIARSKKEIALWVAAQIQKVYYKES